MLITGATNGIGLELAKIFTKRGHPLILVGRNSEKLLRTKMVLEKLMFHRKEESRQKTYNKGQKSIITVTQDLSERGAAKAVYERVKEDGLEVGILINNAGAGYSGEFERASEEKILSLIELNITQLTLLCKYFGKDMKERGHGKLLNVASTGAYHPGAYIAAYYASKAYVLSLSEALYEEFKPYNVSVSALCPGATLTGFQKASGREDTKLAMKPEFVAIKAYEGLMKGKKVIVPGVRNKLMIRMPKKIAVPLIKRYQRSTLLK